MKIYCCSPGTGSKLIQSLDWIKTEGSKLIHLTTLSSDLFVFDVISNPPIRSGLDKAELKSNPVLIVGFEILLNVSKL